MASENKIPDWENKFNIGIDEVDFQHKYFLQLIHRLKKDFHEDLCETMCKRQLNEVIKYAQFHF